MNRGIPAVLVLTTLALTILPAAAKRQSTSRPHHIVAKAPSPRWAHRRTAIAPQRQIACTVAGCNPVPHRLPSRAAALFQRHDDRL
jgi:hypothetical protein